MGAGAAGAASASGQVEIPFLVAALWTALLLVPSVYWIQRQRAQSARWSLAAIALDAEPLDPARLQQALGDVVGDPTLRLVYPLDGGGHVDIAGHAVARPQPGPGRKITTVSRHGRLFALIEHDEALSDERSLAEATSAAAGLAIENAHLYATMQARIEQVRSSRLRLASAALEERQRIQRNLHDGAQQQLVAILVLLDMARHELGPADGGLADQARSTIGRAHGQLQHAIRELRELTEHIYPMTLSEHGLAHAIDSMADLAPVPVSVHVTQGRWPPQVETTAYFVISEALANVYRHAKATWATVTVMPDDGHLLIEVSDNGHGGARVLPGHGLAGLKDRVAAIGGTLSITTSPGEGTRLAARLPLETT
jgi:signal transduction histidine kinase